jgi:hypothetical protein
MMEKTATTGQLLFRLKNVAGAKVRRSLKEAFEEVAKELEKQHLRFIRKMSKRSK